MPARAMNDSPHTPALPEDADAYSRLVMLTYGRLDDGTTYWCYVAVKPSEYDRFMTILKAGKLHLQRFEEDGFGEFIVSGPGLYPPIDITKDVARLFNMPIRELFSESDARSAIARKIEELKKKADEAGE